MLIKNANVLGPEPLGVQDLLVVGGKIVQVRSSLGKPRWVEEVLDCEGRTLVPGLIDLHVHLLGG
ncbi:MAG: beta-aspartyl-peptidase, partial [Candidatus Bipolaricaulaceae bacterium]